MNRGVSESAIPASVVPNAWFRKFFYFKITATTRGAKCNERVSWEISVFLNRLPLVPRLSLGDPRWLLAGRSSDVGTSLDTR